ncbi:unnamed protein product [Hymenolepis diminuta]|uniref:Uncharacterized protein n=1 Tax=Hymenolepis diminuta TaxID=6216 RepID=A0A564ZDP2_HYMDI|nr:unnamed protein product [Hymenolepis diminuta]
MINKIPLHVLVAVRVRANSNETEHQELIRRGYIEKTTVQTPKGKREIREGRERRKMRLTSDSLSVCVLESYLYRHLDEDAPEDIIVCVL